MANIRRSSSVQKATAWRRGSRCVQNVLERQARVVGAEIRGKRSGKKLRGIQQTFPGQDLGAGKMAVPVRASAQREQVVRGQADLELPDRHAAPLMRGKKKID